MKRILDSLKNKRIRSGVFAAIALVAIVAGAGSWVSLSAARTLSQREDTIERLEADMAKLQEEIQLKHQEGVEVDGELEKLQTLNASKLAEAKEIRDAVELMREEIRFLNWLAFKHASAFEANRAKVDAAESRAQAKVSGAQKDLTESKDALRRAKLSLQKVSDLRALSDKKLAGLETKYTQVVALKAQLSELLDELDASYQNACDAKLQLETAFNDAVNQKETIDTELSRLQDEYNKKKRENDELRGKLKPKLRRPIIFEDFPGRNPIFKFGL